MTNTSIMYFISTNDLESLGISPAFSVFHNFSIESEEGFIFDKKTMNDIIEPAVDNSTKSYDIDLKPFPEMSGLQICSLLAPPDIRDVEDMLIQVLAQSGNLNALEALIRDTARALRNPDLSPTNQTLLNKYADLLKQAAAEAEQRSKAADLVRSNLVYFSILEILRHSKRTSATTLAKDLRNKYEMRGVTADELEQEWLMHMEARGLIIAHQTGSRKLYGLSDLGEQFARRG